MIRVSDGTMKELVKIKVVTGRSYDEIIGRLVERDILKEKDVGEKMIRVITDG